eukprot:GILJ01004408.1.p1 GENE.GILJ01004408.1~~GILJ01004408.1.p1  ORF type:complete len:111 (+),score=20.39 GILJ01004408.1:420-752(+)
MLSKVVSTLQMGAFGLVFFGDKIFSTLNMAMPTWLTSVQESKMMTAVSIFFLGNFINGQLMSTGAFEITLNDHLVWSKIQTGKMPTLEVILNALAAQGVEVLPPPVPRNV